MFTGKIKNSFSNIKPLFKRSVISWALYDFANTAFAIVIITVVFPVYFTNIIAPEDIYGKNFGVLMWGISSGVSMLLASACAPVFGAIADTSRSKNKFLTILTGICIIFCLLLYFTDRGMIAMAMAIFIAANFFYQTSMMFYNSFLPELSEKGNVGFISGFGFSLGYLGGLIMLIIIYPFLKNGLENHSTFSIKLTFIITAVFFLVFSLPSFLFLKDKKSDFQSNLTFNKTGRKISYVRYGFQKLHQTFKKIKTNKSLLRFLTAYFLFSNAFSILAVYAAIYGRNTLNLSLQEIALLFILGNFPVIISSFFFGWLVDRIGSKRVITMTLALWCIVIILISVFNLKAVFYVAYILASVITGSTLIASRSLMSILTPYGREAEYFSFYAVGGKFSSILGPVVFGLIAYFTKNERIALLSTLIFLIGGLIVVATVKVPEARVKI
ncbi:MAG: MFS transporter, partial [Actinobacteria bacterium]|nr:MFS transporter [Actinomycetota bacterium]